MVDVVYRDDRHTISSTSDWAMTFLTGDITDIQRIVHNGQMWSIWGWLRPLTSTRPLLARPLPAFLKKQMFRVSLRVDKSIQSSTTYRVLVNPSALIIIVHKAPPLLEAPSNTPRSRQISLNWVALNQSPEHCAALPVWGNSNPRRSTSPARWDWPGRGPLYRCTAAPPRGTSFCVPQRALVPPPC